MNRPRIAVLDYGIGNLRSAQKTLERVGADARLTSSPDEVTAADGVVLPGVGSFGPVMNAIRSSGVDVLAHGAVENSVPFLGICVGMQALYEESEESPGVAGLGVLEGRVRRLPDGVRRPQMQWNQLTKHADSPLLNGIDDGDWVYFVHGYAPELTPDVIATCEYGGTIVAAVEKGPVVATQFHPEKSGHTGLAIVSNFVDMCRLRQPTGR